MLQVRQTRPRKPLFGLLNLPLVDEAPYLHAKFIHPPDAVLSSNIIPVELR